MHRFEEMCVCHSVVVLLVNFPEMLVQFVEILSNKDKLRIIFMLHPITDRKKGSTLGQIF